MNNQLNNKQTKFISYISNKNNNKTIILLLSTGDKDNICNKYDIIDNIFFEILSIFFNPILETINDSNILKKLYEESKIIYDNPNTEIEIKINDIYDIYKNYKKIYNEIITKRFIKLLLYNQMNYKTNYKKGDNICFLYNDKEYFKNNVFNENELYEILYDIKLLNNDKEYFKNNVFKKEELLNDIDQNKIIKQLLSDIKILDGPISFSILIPTKKLNKILKRQAPIMILLGDEHSCGSRCIDNMKTQSGYYSLYDDTFLKYIDNFALTNKIKIDFFIENWIDKDIDNPVFKSNKTNSAIYYMLENVTKCYRKKNNCEYNNIYFHYGDPRNSNNQDINIILKNGFSNTYLELQNKIKMLNRLNNNNLLNDITLLEILKKRIELGSNEFIKFAIDNQVMQKYSKVIKQLKQLPDELQKLFLDYNNYHKENSYKNNFCNNIDNYNNEYKNYYNIFKKINSINDYTEYNNEKYYNFDIIKKIISRNDNIDSSDKYNIKRNECFFYGIVPTLDLYTLSRSLKLVTQSKLCIYYLGNDHIQTMINFLSDKKLYTIYIQVNDNIYIDNYNNKNKCLNIHYLKEYNNNQNNQKLNKEEFNQQQNQYILNKENEKKLNKQFDLDDTIKFVKDNIKEVKN